MKFLSCCNQKPARLYPSFEQHHAIINNIMLLGGRKFGQPHGSYKTCNGQKLQLRKCVPVIFKTSTNQTVPRVLTNESFISEVTDKFGKCSNIPLQFSNVSSVYKSGQVCVTVVIISIYSATRTPPWCSRLQATENQHIRQIRFYGGISETGK